MTTVRFIYTQEGISSSNNLRNILLIGKMFGLENIVLVCLEVLYLVNAVIFSVLIDDVLQGNGITRNNYLLGIRSQEFVTSLVKSILVQHNRQ